MIMKIKLKKKVDDIDTPWIDLGLDIDKYNK